MGTYIFGDDEDAVIVDFDSVYCTIEKDNNCFLLDEEQLKVFEDLEVDVMNRRHHSWKKLEKYVMELVVKNL